MNDEDNRDRAVPARRLLTQLRQNAGAYPGWSPEIVQKLTATLRGPAGRAIRDRFIEALGIELPQIDENALTDRFLAFYGLGSSQHDSLQDLFNLSVPHHRPPPATRDRVERIAVGTLPNLMIVDPLTDEQVVSRAASAFVIPADDSYVIALSTQLSKIVIDFAALISFIHWSAWPVLCLALRSLGGPCRPRTPALDK